MRLSIGCGRARAGVGPWEICRRSEVPDQLRPGDRYELDHGHPIRRALTGGDGARNALLGGQVLNSDPDVTEAGFVPSAKARRELLRTAFELRFGSLTADVAQALDALPRDRLDTVLARALTVATAEAALAP